MKSWHPSKKTLRKIKRNTKKLIKNFETNLEKFHQRYRNAETFDGPSLYFHFQSIKTSCNFSVSDKLSDERFLEYIYATLGTWGLHRMGKTETKLDDFEKIKCQLEEQRNNILDLQNIKIWEIDGRDLDNIYLKLQPLLNDMKISKSNASLVSNTKILHHILPNLIIPIDRNYTLKYFGINTQAPSIYFALDLFKNLFPKLIEVAQDKSDFIFTKINLEEKNWNTSFTKIIDNAIIGALI